MSKGEQTRQRILAQAAEVFNTHGFAGASLGDLMRATGLEKGGIYNHFANKEELALAAFDHAAGIIGRLFQEAIASRPHAADQLLAIADVFQRHIDAPALRGGCPVANTAIEADDTSPALRERAQAAMTSWHKLIGSIVKGGRQRGELRADADPYVVATILTSTLEGALILSRLYDDPVYLQRAIAHLADYISTLRKDSEL